MTASLADSEAADLLLARRLRARVENVDDQDADLEREQQALAALGGPDVPGDIELQGLDPDPATCPPEGADRWLAELPEPLRDEYVQATAEPVGPLDNLIVAEGFTDRRKGAGGGFAAGGVADALGPGPALAGFADDAQRGGLGRLADDELIGVMLAWRRLGARAAAGELAAVAELAARRQAEADASGDQRRAQHVDDEIAAALTLTARAADRKLELAAGLARLPLTAAALTAGDIDERRAAVVVDEVSALDAAHAAAVERQVLGRAPAQTTGQLRAAVRRAVIAADPAAARRRQEQAREEARVEKWDEQRGTAALAGRDLPVPDVLAADQHLTALADELRAAGLDGSTDQLRAKAFLALLAGQPVAGLFPPAAPPCPSGHDPSGPAPAAPRMSAPRMSAPRMSGPGQGSVPRGSVNLTLPLATWLGVADAAGHVAGHGPLDADDARDLAARLAGRSGNRWCLTLTDRDGFPVAHGCARPSAPPGSRARPPGGRPGRVAAPGDGSGAPTCWTFALTVLQSGECAHPNETAAYVVPDRLRHLIEIRQATCAFPGCRRPAARCDVDHTIPHDRGGRTCECGVAPLCRRHHQAKQAPGWRLDQPQPGVMVWTAPGGRTFTTGPTRYP